jgi:competence protein ComEC
MVACDVGQGDGLVLASGQPHAAVVVDAGPDPRLMDRCLDDLGVSRVPLVVLTHFHADHVDGLAGVFAGRSVGEVDISRLQDPPEGVALVREAAARAGLAPRVAPYAVARRFGDLTLEPVWPLPTSPTTGPGDGSTANNASVVLVARIGGVTFLLGGDIEPEGQAALARGLPGLNVDVLKVPHHGSRYQDLPFLASLGARLAVISVGADNAYGHPARPRPSPPWRRPVRASCAPTPTVPSPSSSTTAGSARCPAGEASVACDRLPPCPRRARPALRPPTSWAGSRW